MQETESDMRYGGFRYTNRWNGDQRKINDGRERRWKERYGYVSDTKEVQRVQTRRERKRGTWSGGKNMDIAYGGIKYSREMEEGVSSSFFSNFPEAYTGE